MNTTGPDPYELQNADARGFVLDAAGRLVFDHAAAGPDTVAQYIADYLGVPADERDSVIEIGFEYEDGTFPVLRFLPSLDYEVVGNWNPARGRVTFHEPY